MGWRCLVVRSAGGLLGLLKQRQYPEDVDMISPSTGELRSVWSTVTRKFPLLSVKEGELEGLDLLYALYLPFPL